MNMSNWKPMIEVNGSEEVVECRLCGCKSTDDVFGADSFVFIQKGFGYIQVCKHCATLQQSGQTGLLSVLLKEARDRFEQPVFHSEVTHTGAKIVVPCLPAAPPTTLERLQHIAACAKWARENPTERR